MAKKKKKSAADAGRKIITVNKKARRDYEIIEVFEAGIVLNGAEVKSIRQGSISLAESYVRLRNGECFMVGCHITPYKFSREAEQEPMRDRKLLLHRSEISKLIGRVERKGLTLVPLRVYFNPRGRCKIEIGLGRGKKLYDKREDMKAKTAQREMERALKR